MRFATIGDELPAIDRRVWRPPARVYDWRPLAAIHAIAIHHSATPTTTTWQQIDDYHHRNLGWPGCAYHLLIYADGHLELAQSWYRTSYHVANRNQQLIGLCLVGNWTHVSPSQLQLRATANAIRAIRHDVSRPIPFAGHRDLALPGWTTSCPGATWPTWRRQLEELLL